jgi:hypothetical protein
MVIGGATSGERFRIVGNGSLKIIGTKLQPVENMLSNPLAIAALGRWNCHNRRYHSVVIGDG